MCQAMQAQCSWFCRLPDEPLQAGPVGQAAQGAHGLHQAADPGTGERVQCAQLPHQAQALRDRCRPQPH